MDNKLAISIAVPFRRSGLRAGLEFQDLVQEVWVAALEALQAWKSGGISQENWIRLKARRHLTRVINRNLNKLDTVDTDQEEAVEMDIDTVLGRLDLTSILTEQQALVINLHYKEGFTFSQIAQQLRISQPRVSQLHAQALASLRGYISDLGLGYS